MIGASNNTVGLSFTATGVGTGTGTATPVLTAGDTVRINNYDVALTSTTFSSFVDDVNNAFWEKRFEQINSFERHIAENGTIIFKFFLHLSKDEQKNRLLRRLDKKEKNWI